MNCYFPTPSELRAFHRRLTRLDTATKEQLHLLLMLMLNDLMPSEDALPLPRRRYDWDEQDLKLLDFITHRASALAQHTCDLSPQVSLPPQVLSVMPPLGLNYLEHSAKPSLRFVDLLEAPNNLGVFLHVEQLLRRNFTQNIAQLRDHIAPASALNWPAHAKAIFETLLLLFQRPEQVPLPELPLYRRDDRPIPVLPDGCALRYGIESIWVSTWRPALERTRYGPAPVLIFRIQADDQVLEYETPLRMSMLWHLSRTLARFGLGPDVERLRGLLEKAEARHVPADPNRADQVAQLVVEAYRRTPTLHGRLYGEVVVTPDTLSKQALAEALVRLSAERLGYLHRHALGLGVGLVQEHAHGLER